MVHILAQENTNIGQKKEPKLHRTRQGRLNAESKPEKGVKHPQLQRVVIANITGQLGKTALILNSRYCDITLFDNSAICWAGDHFPNLK